MKLNKQNRFFLSSMTLASLTFAVTRGHAADATWVGGGNQAIGSAIWGAS